MSTIKECFTTRFDGGTLVQFDYSQLEVICLAYLTRCPNLIEDILSGTDMHCRSASFMLSMQYQDIKDAFIKNKKWAVDARHDAKPLGFLVQYGGAAGLMHKQTGLPLADCKNFIKEYYARYSGVERWQLQVAEDVERNRELSTHFAGDVQLGKSTINSVTGRRYTFIEQLAPVWSGRRTSFSPTQMKNFKIQGFATGDIVPMMLGRFNRWLKKEYPNVLLINTTHDSVMADVPENVILEPFINSGIALLESAPYVLREVFGINFDLSLPVEAELGPSWGNLKAWKKLA